MKNLFFNPFYNYIFILSLILITYSLGWSDLYPKLSYDLLLFFLFTVILSFFIGYIQNNYFKSINYKSILIDNKSFLIVLVILILYAFEFINNRGIPLFMILNKIPYDYRFFGVKSLHPFLVTFSSFYSVYLFHQFISVKKFKTFFLFFLIVSMSLLIYNRGMFLIILSSCLFVFLLSITNIKIKFLVILISLGFVIFYLFGISGNYRITNGKTIDNDFFLSISKPSKEFSKSIIPKEFMWTYVYVASPIATVQHNINSNTSVEIDLASFFCYELLPDFISKRLGDFFSIKKVEPELIVNWSNVGSIYSKVYCSLGWLGMFIIFLVLMIIISLYLLILNESSAFYVTGVAILNTFVIFNFFDNMIAFSGISLQLFFPLIATFFGKKNHHCPIKI